MIPEWVAMIDPKQKERASEGATGLTESERERERAKAREGATALFLVGAWGLVAYGIWKVFR